MDKICKNCKVIITKENGSLRRGALRNVCMKCRSKLSYQYKKLKLEDKLIECTICKTLCIKKIAKPFCSNKCRFLGYVKKDVDDQGCWIWTGKNIKKDGYGRIMLNGKEIGAHRASYELFKGHIPKNYLVLHSCHIRLCVNPDHLRYGTVKDNAKDMMNASRQRKGSRHGFSKLIESQIIEIRKLYSEGYPQQKIADLFNVTQPTIGFIIRGKTWKHVY